MKRRATSTQTPPPTTGRDFTSCVGCTDAEACNYNPEATVDDGSCVMPDPVDGCTDTCDFPVSVTESALGQGAAGSAVEFGAYGTLTTLDVTLNWSQSEGTGAWPADMLVEVGLPDGSCVALGGYDVTSASCTDLGNYAAVWPDTWQVSDAGTYTTSVDVSGAGLSGTGLWSITLTNGWSTGGASNYDVTFTMTGLCTSDDIDIPGCTDATACNYDPNATVDDGSCDFSSCSGCTDAMACNYNPNATEDDGSCEFDSCWVPMRRLATTTLLRPSTMALACNWMRVAFVAAMTALAAVAQILMRTTTTPMPSWTTAAALSRQIVPKT